MKLTTKQVNFCKAIAYDSLNPTDAYRQAYDAENMAPSTITNSAYKLVKRGDVTAMIEELKAPQAFEFSVSRSQLLKEVYGLATLSAHDTVRLGAWRLIADIQGDITRKAEIHTSSDNPLATLTIAELDMLLDAMRSKAIPEAKVIDVTPTEALPEPRTED